ncbi:uncharacterized protein [Magallana gigas]|uniref:uncharacterized protein n=1 Tax=Magallana gigas TaxID=29159 RepID=UPI0005C36372|eukprot:XP_011438522.1 PREDICTED: uncharacterized protein LOC105336047 isoform X1 [Crassostrea gigas]
MFRYFLIFSLTFLLLTEDVSGGWRRRFRKFVRKAAKVAKTVATVHTVAKVAAAVVGKRSTDDEVFSLNVCNFNSFDLDEDQKISETELSTLIDITGAEDLDEFFEKLDVNKDDAVTIQEYKSSQLIKEICI